MKTKYVIQSLDIQVEGQETLDSLRPKWVIRFDKDFRFQSQYKDSENNIKHRHAPILGAFIVEKITHKIDCHGHYQYIYLKEDGWKAEWQDDPST